jgi:hypothetical protein
MEVAVCVHKDSPASGGLCVESRREEVVEVVLVVENNTGAF